MQPVIEKIYQNTLSDAEKFKATFLEDINNEYYIYAWVTKDIILYLDYGKGEDYLVHKPDLPANEETATDAEIKVVYTVIPSFLTHTVTPAEGTVREISEISVVFNAETGYANFNKESVDGIVQYARTSVGSNSTEDITIIDNQGNLLYSGVDSNSTTSNVTTIKQQVEEYYNSKLWNLLVNSGSK